MYRTVDDPLLKERERIHAPPLKSAPHQSIDWSDIAERFRRNLTPALADELCARLGLPRIALDSLPLIGHDGEAWTFPEENGKGRIVGIARRFSDGSKRMMPGSRRGLTIPKNWRERETPVVIVEGQSDELALSLCAVSCIGRSSNTGGVEMLAELLSDLPLDRSVIVLGENDQKPDGTWPGRDGAVRVAHSLAERLQRRIGIAFPPAGIKDAREWALSRNPDLCILDDWHLFGEILWELQ